MSLQKNLCDKTLLRPYDNLLCSLGGEQLLVSCLMHCWWESPRPRQNIEKAHKQRASYYRFTPRFNHFSNYENEVFGDDQNTEIMVLTAQQKEGFKRYYPGCNSRLHDLPPGISPDRRLESRREIKRIEFRKRFRISESDLVLLQVGSGFKIKGVDDSK